MTDAEYIAELERRNGEMAFLIGLMHVGLVELLNTPGIPAIPRGKLITLNDTFNDKVSKLFYKDENENKKN